MYIWRNAFIAYGIPLSRCAILTSSSVGHIFLVIFASVRLTGVLLRYEMADTRVCEVRN